MDEITLTGLRVFGRHGVYEDERRVGQYFVVDFTLFIDTRRAADTESQGRQSRRFHRCDFDGGDPQKRVCRASPGKMTQR